HYLRTMHRQPSSPTLFPYTTLFRSPPSIAELERRLRSRGQDSEAVIQRRLANAQAEMAHADEFEYRIINKDFDTAKAELAEIIRDRKSTRLNSSHGSISYAVFCLKK